MPLYNNFTTCTGSSSGTNFRIYSLQCFVRQYFMSRKGNNHLILLTHYSKKLIFTLQILGRCLSSYILYGNIAYRISYLKFNHSYSLINISFETNTLLRHNLLFADLGKAQNNCSFSIMYKYFTIYIYKYLLLHEISISNKSFKNNTRKLIWIIFFCLRFLFIILKLLKMLWYISKCSLKCNSTSGLKIKSLMFGKDEIYLVPRHMELLSFGDKSSLVHTLGNQYPGFLHGCHSYNKADSRNSVFLYLFLICFSENKWIGCSR